MRENDRIDTPNTFAQYLSPEICAGIYDPRAFRRFDIDRGAQPLVARIGRVANIAIATNHRHALRCSGAEKDHRKL
jgi:hypothetical protein